VTEGRATLFYALTWGCEDSRARCGSGYSRTGRFRCGLTIAVSPPPLLSAAALLVVVADNLGSHIGNVTLGLLLRFVTRELQCANDTYRLHRGDPGSPAARR
jgi:hypothetical protein